MSRLKKFTHSLLSGYVLLGANILYTFASVPLALHYLSMEEFGLWAVVMQVTINLQLLVDLGMSGSVSRILIDHKDDEASTGYGTVIQTGGLTMLIQGGLVGLVGGIASLWLPQLMNVSPEFWRIFQVLMIWQCAFLGLSFPLRLFTFILQAHQRSDVSNYSNVGGFAVNLLALWAGFHWQLGLYSMLAASAANLLFSNVYCLIAVVRLRLLPAKGRWGKANWHAFREIFTYANDIFLLSVGQVLISVSQVPVISATLGLKTAALWSVATKVFSLAQQMIARIIDYSAPAFAEMMVRNEREKLRARFRDVVVLTAAAGVLVCLTLAACNRSFIVIWTHNRFSWSAADDLLMAMFVILCTTTRCHIGLAGLTKQILAMKYIYVLEGVTFVGLSLLLARHLHLAGIILGGIMSNFLCSGLYGLQRTTRYFQIPSREVLCVWLAAPARMFLLVLTVGVVLWFATRQLQPIAQFVVNVAIASPIGVALFWWIGLSPQLQSEATTFFHRLRGQRGPLPDQVVDPQKKV